MKTSIHDKISSKGFTLIELITVIGIILVLMGLLFPAIQNIKEATKRAQAKNDVTQIVTGVNAYYTEYGKYPLVTAQLGWDTIFGNVGGNPNYPNDTLMDVLSNNLNGNNQSAVALLNPRGIVFFSANNVKSASSPKSGIATQNATSPHGNPIRAGEFLDPWGEQYIIGIDGDYSGMAQVYTVLAYTDLKLSNDSQSPTPGPAVSAPVIAASFGKDGKIGTNGDGKYNGSDDVISWQ